MKQVSMIGLHPQEVVCARRFVHLLRHPDPVVAELTRQALTYLEDVANRPKSSVEQADNPQSYSAGA